MCQSIPACYEKSRRNVFWDLCDDIRDFLSRNPGASDEDIKSITAQLCLKEFVKVDDLLKYFKKDLEKGRKLISDPKKSDAVHKIQKRYCECYERVLSAYGLL
jgi:hypothetical protein